MNNSDQIRDTASKVSAGSCLDSGWRSIEHLLDEDVQVFKANAFLASLSRIDDDRMKGRYATQSDNKYVIETYSVSERERMMGLPVGYVERPLQYLFEQLRDNAFKLPETNIEDKTYSEYKHALHPLIY